MELIDEHDFYQLLFLIESHAANDTRGKIISQNRK